MTVVNKKIQYSVGIDDLFICMMDGVDPVDGIPKYSDTIYRIPTITDLTITATTTNFTKWASNKKIINIVKNTAFGLAYNLSGLPREVRDLIFGFVSTRGISFEDANAREYPIFATGAIFPLSDGTTLARWYPKCTVAPVEEKWTTQNDELTVDDIPYVITADPLLFSGNTQAELDSGRADAEGVTVDKFMAQVVCDESQIEELFGDDPNEGSGDGDPDDGDDGDDGSGGSGSGGTTQEEAAF